MSRLFRDPQKSGILPLGAGRRDGSREKQESQGRGDERKTKLALKQHRFSQKLSQRKRQIVVSR